MLLTILGCGTSTGVPVILCKCKVCRSRNPKNKRLRTSAWIQIGGKSLLIDTGPDFRQQAMRAQIARVDAVLYTHPHADHVHGIDELRSFNFVQKAPIPVYGNEWTCGELKAKFAYIFKPGYVEGGGIPHLDLNLIQTREPVLEIMGQKIIPLSLQHGSKECVGYRIDSIAYVTDCSYIPPSSIDRMRGISVLILDCLRLKPHGTHFNLDQALETVSILKPKRTFLTHLGHELEYVEWARKLPKGVSFAYDGLTIKA
jgi:phosphoribosyl 1,2-cyclic phosphate phosphodiesterase